MTSLILAEGVELPVYSSKGAVGADVTAVDILAVYKGTTEIVGEKFDRIRTGFLERGFIKLRGFERILFDTGITIADMPGNIELQVRSRSGLALKRGLVVANSPGTIDPDYRGKLGVIMYNTTPYPSPINKGERIAQIVSKFIIKEEFGKTYEIVPSSRGAGGFGSTGEN